VKFFSRKSKALKKWHNRALLIDPKKTKLILLGTDDGKSVPPWVYKRFNLPQANKERIND
jgi:hypothetical protein